MQIVLINKITLFIEWISRLFLYTFFRDIFLKLKANFWADHLFETVIQFSLEMYLKSFNSYNFLTVFQQSFKSIHNS